MCIWFEGRFEGRFEGGLKHGLKSPQTNTFFDCIGTTTSNGLKLGLKVSLINMVTP